MFYYMTHNLRSCEIYSRLVLPPPRTLRGNLPLPPQCLSRESNSENRFRPFYHRLFSVFHPFFTVFTVFRNRRQRPLSRKPGSPTPLWTRGLN